MTEEITQVLGIVAMENKGVYSADAYYEKLNIVTYNGSSYSAKTDVHGINPTNTDYWQLIAEKGDKGDADMVSFDIIDNKLVMYESKEHDYTFQLNDNKLEVVYNG